MIQVVSKLVIAASAVSRQNFMLMTDCRPLSATLDSPSKPFETEFANQVFLGSEGGMDNRFLEYINIDKNHRRLFEIKCLYDMIQQGFRGTIERVKLAQIVIKGGMADLGTEKTERHVRNRELEGENSF